jgi:seryl-tRNA synthetase
VATPTQIDHEAFNSIIQKHQGVQEYIQQQQAQVASEVDNARAQNSGAMIDSLVSVHEDWDAKMKDINNNLNQMIHSMQTTLNRLQSQDSENVIK